MKFVGYFFTCHLALGLALPLTSPKIGYPQVMMRALQKEAIDCPQVSTPDCTGMRSCTLPADQFGCPTGTFCMAQTMNLPDGTICQTLCPKHECSRDQQYCQGGHKTDDGCPKEDYCLDKLDANGYQQTCDEVCEKGETQCPRLYDGNGTPQPKACVVDINNCPTAHSDGTEYDEYGCEVHAEVHCQDGTLCHGNFCSEFCRNPDVCIQDGNNVDGNGCPRQCPEAGCQIYEFECATTYNNVGCPNEKVCVAHPSQCPKTEFEQGTGCPVYEVTCDDETELKCDSPKTTIGAIYLALLTPVPEGANANQICDAPKSCVAKVSKSARDVECTVDTCPTAECPNGQQLCDMGFEKLTGCPNPVGCAIDCPEITVDERGCDTFEEPTCDAGESLCDPIYDQNGCEEMPQCIPDDGSCNCPEQIYDQDGCQVAKSKNNPPEGLECGELMNKCFMGYDQSTGCGKGYQCLEKFCDDFPDCELSCPTVCPQNKRTCRRPNKDDGCPQLDTCEPLTYDNEREEVYGGTVTCQNFCEPLCDDTLCPATYDENGCQQVKECVQNIVDCPVSTYDENGCQVFDVTCNPDEKECDGGFDERNCPKQPTCQPAADNCPVVCQFDEMLCDLGEATFPHINDPVALGNVCVKRKVEGGIYGQGMCDNVCPPQCDLVTEKAVFGGYDATSGCKLQEKCIDKAADYHATLNAIRTCDA